MTLGLTSEAFDVLVEVLVDAVDEDRERGLDGPEPRHEVPVGIGGAPQKLARGEVQQPDEMVDDAVQPPVVDQPGEAWPDGKTVHGADLLERGDGNGREP